MALSYISGLLPSYQYSMGLLEIQQCIFCLRIFPSYSYPRRLDIISMCIHLQPSSLLWLRMVFPFADPKVSQSLEAFVQCLTSLPRVLWPGCLPPSLPRAAGIQAWSASCFALQASPRNRHPSSPSLVPPTSSQESVSHPTYCCYIGAGKILGYLATDTCFGSKKKWQLS